jgi:hypothetical protein
MVTDNTGRRSLSLKVYVTGRDGNVVVLQWQFSAPVQVMHSDGWYVNRLCARGYAADDASIVWLLQWMELACWIALSLLYCRLKTEGQIVRV